MPLSVDDLACKVFDLIMFLRLGGCCSCLLCDLCSGNVLLIARLGLGITLVTEALLASGVEVVYVETLTMVSCSWPFGLLSVDMRSRSAIYLAECWRPCGRMDPRT